MPTKRKATDFAVGSEVCLARVANPDFRGKRGVVHKIIKSRNAVCVAVDRMGIYRAYPDRIDLVVPA